MIVELRKTKITKSIVDQSLLGHPSVYYNYDKYDILGWCVVVKAKSKLRYILLYHREEKVIVKVRSILSYIKDIELYQESVQRMSPDKIGYIYPTVYKIKVYWADFNNAQVIKEQNDESDEDMIELFNKIKQLVIKTEQLGQIYI